MTIQKLSFAQYHALDAWGSSSLRAMRRGPPARVLWEKDNRALDTDATRLGTAVHCRLLEPERYEESYAHKPEGMSFATKDGKAWRAELPDGVIILTHVEWELVQAIFIALCSKEPVASVLDDASHREVSLVWECPSTQEDCKGRPDVIAKHWLYDLKVSRHADSPALAYRTWVEGWMHQLAHYRTGAQACGLDVRGGRLIVVSPTAPHFVHTLEVKTDALDLLELENLATLAELRRCRMAGDWPGTPDDWKKIEPPPQAMVEFGSIIETATEDPT